LAKTPPHGKERERGESFEREVASTEELSDAEADEIMVRGLEGSVVYGVGRPGSLTGRCGGM